jgi:hypothetical protein
MSTDPLRKVRAGEILSALDELATLDGLTASPAELNTLAGVTAGTGAANKAVVLDSNGGATIPGELALDGNALATLAGVGITAGVGTIYKTGVLKIGSIIHTRILLDLTGLNSAATLGDIIGVDGVGVAHLGRITAARNGTILSGRITCLETPAGGEVDIDLYAATEATGVEDVGIGTLAETALLETAADWTETTVKVLATMPAADKYLYLTVGTSDTPTAGTYTAGKFLIELEGYDA